jgi:hypothetical protein
MTNNDLKSYLDQAVNLEVKKLSKRLDDLAVQPAHASKTAKQYNPLSKVVQALKQELVQAKDDKQHLLEPISSKQLSKISHSSKLAYLQAKAAYLEAIKQAQAEYDAIQAKELQEIGIRNARLLEQHQYKSAIQHGTYAEAVLAIGNRKRLIDQQGTICEVGISGHSFKGILSDNVLESFEVFIDDEISVNGGLYAVVKADYSPIGASNYYKVKFLK